MELFDHYKAVLLPQENKILITSENGYIYYVYDCQKKYWYKYDRAGNVQITIDHYPAVSNEVLMEAMHGVMPQKKADFIRLCHAFQDVSDISEILEADYPDLMADYTIMEPALDFLKESPVRYSSYLMLRKILGDSIATECDKQHLAAQIKRLSYIHIGKDIFKQELRIFDNAYLCGGFHIMPARLIGSWDGQYPKDDIAKMHCVAIGIGEDDVWNYLSPFLCKHYAKDLEANKRNYVEEGFDWGCCRSLILRQSLGFLGLLAENMHLNCFFDAFCGKNGCNKPSVRVRALFLLGVWLSKFSFSRKFRISGALSGANSAFDTCRCCTSGCT